VAGCGLEVAESRKTIQAKIEKCDFAQAREQLFETYRLDKPKIVDRLQMT